jgi:hypothetical protein
MGGKLLLLFVAFVFVLSSCSHYKKVDLDNTKVKFDISVKKMLRSSFEISRKSTLEESAIKTIYTLTGLSINDKVVKLKNDSIVLSPKSKYNIETESIGDIKIRLNKENDPLSEYSYDVDLWMTKQQINKMK